MEKDKGKFTQLNKENWDTWADTYDSKNWRNNYLQNLQIKLISAMGIQEGLHFLDIGCGTGFAIAEAARKVGGHGQFFGIDLSTKMIEQAKRKFDGIGNFTFIESNAESIPLESNFFDVIICTNSFHHYYHPQKALGEMYRLLKNSGKVYILDPTNDGLLMKIMERFMKFGPEHAKLYSSREFESLYVQTGFRYLGHFPDVKFNIGTKVHIGEK